MNGKMECLTLYVLSNRLSCILGFLALCLYVSLPAVVKLGLMVVMVMGYLVLLTYTHPGLFHTSDRLSR